LREGNNLITCENMLKMPGMEKMKLVAGQEGLGKIISWVHVIEIPDVVEWVEGGELLFITGVTIKDNTQALLKLVKDLDKKKLSGLVINVGPYIKKTPQEVIELANSLKFPIFEVPFAVKLIEITHMICREIFSNQIKEESINSFMNELIFGRTILKDENIKRAVKYGYDINKDYCALIVDIDDFKNYLKNNNIDKEEKIIEFKEQILQIIDNIMKNYKKKYMHMIQSDSFYLMISVDKNSKRMDFINKIASSINEEIKKNIDNITVSIGIGGKACSLAEFKSAVLEAQNAMKISRKLNGKDGIGDCRKLGVYKLFFDMENQDAMTDLYNEILGNLKEYEKNSSKELLYSLQVYIDENRNIGKAAEKLFIHRNTMKYRINKIEEILECDLKDDKTMFHIMLGIKIGKFLGFNMP
jgi:DNA-binding PucR family transcriptional regulator